VRYPLSYLNTFEGGCDAYLLDFGFFPLSPGVRLHRRDVQSAVLAALAIWRSPFSFYMLGAALLGVFSFGIARALNLGARYAVHPALLFPLRVSLHPGHWADQARVSLAPALALLVRGTLRDARRSRQLIFGTLAAVLVLVCVEDKPFYLFVAPTILVCAIAFGMSADGTAGPAGLRRAARQRATHWLAFSVILTTGLGVLFLSATATASPTSHTSGSASAPSNRRDLPVTRNFSSTTRCFRRHSDVACLAGIVRSCWSRRCA